MDKRKDFVVGLLFDKQLANVVLLKKKHGPNCVIGKWNGPGGGINDNEEPLFTIQREFKEETGVDIRNWTHFCTLNGTISGIKVHFFYSTVDADVIKQCKTTTDEPVRPFNTDSLPPNIMYNLTWMIAFLRDPTTANSLGNLDHAN